MGERVRVRVRTEVAALLHCQQASTQPGFPALKAGREVRLLLGVRLHQLGGERAEPAAALEILRALLLDDPLRPRASAAILSRFPKAGSWWLAMTASAWWAMTARMRLRLSAK